MHPDQKTFEILLKEDPYGINLRLVYSDWLEEQGLDDEAAEHRRWTPEWQRAEDYLREYAAQLKPYPQRSTIWSSAYDPFPVLIEELKAGELFGHGSDLHGLYELDDANELKANAEIYLRGKTINWSEFNFSCSC